MEAVTEGVGSEKPLPTSRPSINSDALRAAMEKIRGGGKLDPYYKQLDFIDRELARVHELIRAKLAGRESVYEEDKTLRTLQQRHGEVLDELREAAKAESVGVRT